MNNKLKANAELEQANIKCASARSAWLRSSLDLNTVGSDHLTKEANNNREVAWAEYQRCQADIFRISKMARLLKR